MSTATTESLIHRIRRELEDEPWEDYITSSSTAADTTITVNQGSAWTEGDVGEFDDGSLDQFKVATGTTSPITVRRGHNDTTATQHDSGAVVLKNPKLGGWQILNALEETVAELWPYVWVTRSTTVTPSTTETVYTMPVDFIDLISVTQQQTPATPAAYISYGARGGAMPATVMRGLPVASVGSGMALNIPILDNTTNAITVRYRAEPTLTDIEEGLMSTTVVLGACGKLAVALDSSRVVMQPPNAPYGQGLRSAQWYELKFRENRWRLRNLLLKSTPPARVYVG